jgi:hypothetical protein
MTRATWSTSDTPRIRAALLAAVGSAPLSSRVLRIRVAERTGIEIGERRLLRALAWAIAGGRARRVKPASWRDEGGYVRAYRRAAEWQVAA